MNLFCVLRLDVGRADLLLELRVLLAVFDVVGQALLFACVPFETPCRVHMVRQCTAVFAVWFTSFVAFPSVVFGPERQSGVSAPL
jgi:hypothetical protein